MTPAVGTLKSIIGPENLVQSEDIITAHPGSVEEVCEIVRWAGSEGARLAATGQRTRSYMAGKVSSDVLISTDRLCTVTDYQPENLVFCAQSGMTGNQAIDYLSSNKQMLALDVPGFWQGSLGGTVATRLQGPASFGAGGVRDLLISVHVVNAEGQLVKGGAKVVKNVSGYDLPKLYAGSFGTLGIIVETSFRLAPYPEASIACIAELADWKAAETITEKIFLSPLYPRSLEALSPSALQQAGLPSNSSTPVYVAVFDGSVEQVDYQKVLFTSIVSNYGSSAVQTTELTWHSDSHRTFASGRLAASGIHCQVYCLSSEVAAIAQHVDASLKDYSPIIFAGIGGGYLDILFPASTTGDFNFSEILQTIKRLSPSATVAIHTSLTETRESILSDDIAGHTLMRKIKQALDPSGVFPAGWFEGAK